MIGLTSHSHSKPMSASPATPGFLARLRQRLNRGDSFLTRDIAEFIPGGRIDEATLEELETRLLLADVGVDATREIMSGLQERLNRKQLKDIGALRAALADSMTAILASCAKPLIIDVQAELFVLLMVGVNGAGKTTTIGKLANRFKAQGKQVMLAAGDTFRAAAIEQLQVWGARHDVPVIAQPRGADPAAVAHDALQTARARKTDVLIVDTAGRLHTQEGLMAELQKIKRVLARLDAGAPHEVLLVLDGGTGQNALAQARQFHAAVGVTGLAVTKLDGTAKGGMLLAIARQLQLPIRFIGIGEGADDLQPFDAREFVQALLGE